MSIRCNGIDKYATLSQALSIGTGNFYIGCWTYVVNAQTGAFLSLFDVAYGGGYTDYAWIRCPSTTSFRGETNGGYIAGYSSVSTGTWYYTCLQRSGTTLRFRTFDDSTSTTPLYDGTTTVSTNYNSLTYIHLMAPYTGYWLDGEMASLKVLTGVALSDSECRTESQNLDVVKTGATLAYAWDLEDVDADTQGLNERNGSGPNFTNNSLIAGAYRPSQLEAQGGGYDPPILPFLNILLVP